jgi:hypothetical protein
MAGDTQLEVCCAGEVVMHDGPAGDTQLEVCCRRGGKARRHYRRHSAGGVLCGEAVSHDGAAGGTQLEVAVRARLQGP